MSQVHMKSDRADSAWARPGWRVGRWAAPVLVCLGLSVTAGRANAQTVEYIHTDALGSPVATTNASGAVIERQVYEPYGAPISHGPTDGPGFTGHVEDSATGLAYMQQRYYDPLLGVFISVDPDSIDATASNFGSYAYAENSPYNNTDPDGRTALREQPTTGSHIRGSNAFALMSVAGMGRMVVGGVIAPPVRSDSQPAQASTPPSIPAAPDRIPGGPWEPNSGGRPGNFLGPKQPGGRGQLQWVPPEGQGGPPGSRGYWKTNMPQQKGWQRYDRIGNPITPGQAHPSPNRWMPILKALERFPLILCVHPGCGGWGGMGMPPPPPEQVEA